MDCNNKKSVFFALKPVQIVYEIMYFQQTLDIHWDK